MKSDREQAEELCDVWKHQWKEEYYGYRCENCDMFIPFGCEPWIDYEDDDGPRFGVDGGMR